MPVIAVVNRKGGSGKSTLATHLAVHLAAAGGSVLLGDVDPQHSTQGWLRRRGEAQRAGVLGWPVDPKAMVRPPAGAGAVVLDTPGGLRGFELARVVMYADAILMPVCNSAFDRESAAACYAELLTLPRVAAGRCRLAAIGMRIDGRTRGADTLDKWARGLGLAYIGTLRETQSYVRCIEAGLTVFDLPVKDVQPDLAQWAPILDWVDAALAATAAPTQLSPQSATASMASRQTTTASRAPTVLPAVTRAPVRLAAPPAVPSVAVPAFLTKAAAERAPVTRTAPAQADREPMVAMTASAPNPRATPPVAPSSPPAARAPTRPAPGALGNLGRLLGGLSIPRFLQRDRVA